MPTFAIVLLILGFIAGLLPAAYLLGWRHAHESAHKPEVRQ
jgi:F0F1-type ATP synthase assembly protein I